MKVYIIGTILFFTFQLVSTGLIAQQSIADQYEELNKKGSSWQDYKLIKRNQWNAFYRNLGDTLNERMQNINTLKKTLSAKDAEISNLENSLSETQSLLEKTKKEQNSLPFLGLMISKGTYNTIVWLIIVTLGLILAYFIFIFKNANSVTMKSKESYNKLKEEFNGYRQKTLEKEQVLMRRLQDELNKNAK